ncbi:TIGR03617 family F420-dependent LLM class oxidoreductase [Nakamurella leprariae]|uniref:TIGR03617 family F420-dependent LLM class oxidoreductase n=1 Tax=Nakamurella leprariae TaxID=2803911 RepID=A0A939C0E5_9ACTN|nr:TIGR03617 family F420-dependent LLM class oxidoreductase [Nakamurella leprariae]MBM9468671.1 TIGR03617 family F420-dependent LLM class oxidoreductase [Nakamurella leprariae]
MTTTPAPSDAAPTGTTAAGSGIAFDSGIAETDPDIAGTATRLEQQGYGGLHIAELTRDPFINAALALTAAHQATVATQVAVAFARNPMTVALSTRHLQDLSGGRFVLGLGTQVAAHVTKRFSMPWSKPAARMEEFIRALRAIWQTWDTGDRLAFRGEFYTHTLMTPAFSPPPAAAGNSPIHLAAVGPLMCRTAGRVADGVVVHAFCTPKYLAEVITPAVQGGRAEAEADGIADSRPPFQMVAPVFVVTGATAEQRESARSKVSQQIAFYGSTPAYRDVLAGHGWGELADQLHALSVSRDPGKWTAMGELITDDVLAEFAVVTDDPADVPAQVVRRYRGLVDRVVVGRPEGVSVEDWSAAIRAVG